MYPNRSYGVSDSISESSRDDKRRGGSEHARGRKEFHRRTDYLFDIESESARRCCRALRSNTERVKAGTMAITSG